MRRFVVGLGFGVLVAMVVAVVLPPAALGHKGSAALEFLYGSAIVDVVSGRSASQTLPDAGASRRPGATSQLLADAGRNAYTGSCAECHGARGDGKSSLGEAMVPAATDLTSRNAKQKSDAQLFWIIKNGLGFTAMPAYAEQYGDPEIAGLVDYVRALQNGQGSPVVIPTPTAPELAFADRHGSAAQRGSAVYFAQGCQLCHGGFGEASDELAIQDISDAIRQGRPGMPTYDSSRIGEAELADVLDYLRTGPAAGDQAS